MWFSAKRRPYPLDLTGMQLRWLVPGDITGAATLLSKPSRYQMGTEVLKDSWFLVWDRITVGRDVWRR
jgi:hypothetical protein